MWVTPGPGVAGQVAGDEADQGAAVGRGQQPQGVAVDGLVAGLGELERGGQVDPELDAVGAAAVAEEGLGRDLVVEDPGAGGHPLGVALADDPAAAVAVVVLDDPVDHVGDGLEAPVRVPRGADRLVGGVVDRPELVEQEEGVGHVGVEAAGERAPDLEAGALDGVVGGRRPARPGGRGVSGSGVTRGSTSGFSTVTAGISRSSCTCVCKYQPASGRSLFPAQAAARMSTTKTRVSVPSMPAWGLPSGP